ncbi:MAG: hypothetical protein MI861_22620, partial [Pirellulales bacterium]|nr:hypothetical protein [Pirellulales bacterium]
VRPAGDEVHTYARLQWTANQKKSDTQWYTSVVSAKIIYTPGLRRVHEISYEDNYWVPYRNTIHVDLVSKINDQFDLRDGVLAPVQQMILDPGPDRLPPRTPAWRFNPFAGDRPWHVSIADDRIRPTNVLKR